jgi:hypothetical protein
MHPIAIRKAIIKAYMAGAEVINGGGVMPTRRDAVDYYDDEFGALDLSEQECDCCIEDDEE